MSRFAFLARRSVAATSLGVFGAALLSVSLLETTANAGSCPVPACVPGELVVANSTIPSNAPGIAYRQMQGKYINSSPDSGLDDAGDPIPPRYYAANAELLDETGAVTASNLDDDPADPTYKILKPAGGLRPNRTYKVRFDRECATGNTQPPPATGEVKTGEVSPQATNVGTVEVLSKRVETRDVPNPEDGGCTVKKEVSVVRIKYTPSKEISPYAKMLGYRASLDNEESGPLKYQIGNPDGTLETDVFIACPTTERSVKGEVLVRTIGAAITPPPASVDVTVLPCGEGVFADAGGDGGNKAAAASGCSCDTSGESNSGMAGLTFALGAMATAMLVRGVARRRSR